MGLRIRRGVPRRAYLPLGSTSSHLDRLQAVPQVLDLDRGGRKATARKVALPLQSHYVQVDSPRVGP
jgi:hypothetical protein